MYIDVKFYNNLLKKYPSFKYETVDFHTEYRIDKDNLKYIEKYDFKRLLEPKDFLMKLINVCRFVYRFVPAFKPLIDNPYKYNGFELMNLCMQGHSLNCAGYSIMFNDLMLTLGFKSKCVYCRPYDFYDLESHVLCQVYNEKTDRWIVVDSAQGSIPCDENNEGINILELRDRIMNQKKIKLLRSRHSYHSEEFYNKYISYLNKDLFMFLSIDSYGLDYRTDGARLIVPDTFELNKKDIPFEYLLTNNSFYLLH